jgi:hypothetical protein
MLALLLAALITSPEAQATAVDTWCASQPLQVVARKAECNPVLADRNRDVSRFLVHVETDRAEAIMATATPFATPDLANPFDE